MAAVLVDAGPLIAYFDESDARHRDALACFQSLSDPALTTWPVVAEAAYMLGKISIEAQLDLLGHLMSGNLELAPLAKNDVKRISELMEKYADRRMDLADATLVRVAEREGISTVATFDKKDFRIYRAAGIGPLKVVP